MVAVDNESADGIRRWTEAGQRAFCEAVNRSLSRWQEEILAPEAPDRTYAATRGGAWTPHHASFHTLLFQWFATEMAAQLASRARMDQQPPFLEDRSGWYARRGSHTRALQNDLRDVVRARAIVEERCASARHELADLSDSDLELPVELLEPSIAYVRTFGIEHVPATVRSLLTLNALHLHDHADQIRRAGGDS